MADTPPSLRELKRRARAWARGLGHTLGRFASSDPEHGEPYAMARCQACLTACVVVSPTRYDRGHVAMRRLAGGAAIREVCPTPFPPEHEVEDTDDCELDILAANIEAAAADIVWGTPGSSPGCDAEIAYAREHGIPVKES